MRMANINVNLNYFMAQSGSSRNPNFGRETIFADPWYIAYGYNCLNASFHVGGPLTAGALRPVPHGLSYYGTM